MAHVIRLRAPWEIEPLPERGLVRCTRHFNKPTGLDHGERVWLVVEGLPRPATIDVNEVRVGDWGQLTRSADEPVRCDITPLLAERNKVVIELPGDVTEQALQRVRLEIDAA